MTDLSTLLQNGDAIENGAWIKPGTEYGDLEIRTRGATDEYIDAHATARNVAAAVHGGDIPNKVLRKIQIDAWSRHCFMDVRGIEENGAPVPAERFLALLHTADGRNLWSACQTATAKVAAAERVQQQADEGN